MLTGRSFVVLFAEKSHLAEVADNNNTIKQSEMTQMPTNSSKSSHDMIKLHLSSLLHFIACDIVMVLEVCD